MNRQDLVAKLEMANLALAKDALVPMLQCFQFTKKNVVATNDQVGVTIACTTEDSFAVNGKILLELLQNSRAEDVDLSLVDHDLVVKTGKSVFKLPYLPEDDFLIPGSGKTSPLFSLPITDELLTGIKACLMTASNDATQPALMGVTIHHDKKNIQFCSCDGDAVTRFTTDAKPSKHPDIMLPNGFCEALVKVAATTGLGQNAQLVVDSGWAKASLSGGYIVRGRIIENDNPLNHDDVIKKTLKGEQKYVKLPDTLADALSRAVVVAKAESAKTVLTVEGGKLKLLTETHMGVVRDSVPLSGHPDVTAEVSAELMQRTIAICDEIAITDRCVAYRSGETLFQIISNITK